MLNARFRPLEKWKDGQPQNKSDQFRASYIKTLDRLEYELGKLRAQDIVIEAGFTLPQLRNDGWPYGNAQPSHGGIVLYFKSPDGPMRFPCYTYADWQANLHAIALTLERLRDIDRYGVTLGHQQYLGFKALPVASDNFATVEDAAQFLATQANGIGGNSADLIWNHDSYRSAYREAAQRLHPDRGGNQHMWTMLQNAKALLDKHHQGQAA